MRRASTKKRTSSKPVVRRRCRTTYRLPRDQYETTYSVKQYVKEWYAIMNPLKKIPGVEIHAFDPSIQIRFENKVVDMPVRFVKALSQILVGNVA